MTEFMWMIGLYLFLGLPITDAGSQTLLIGMEESQSMAETTKHHDSSLSDDLHESVSGVDLMDPTMYPPPFFASLRDHGCTASRVRGRALW